MAYTKTTWVNEAPATTPVKYKLTDDTLGIVAASAKIEVLTSVTPGTPMNATNLNHMEQGIEDAHALAAAAIGNANIAVVSNSSLSIADGATIPVPFTSEDVDTSNFVDLGAHPTRITIPAGMGGWYSCNGVAYLDYYGDRRVTFYVNGSAVSWAFVEFYATTGIGPSHLQINRMLYLAAGDYLELYVHKATGGGTTTTNRAWLEVALMYKA